MTGSPKRPRHPGQDDRRDSRKLRGKTDPDRAGWARLAPEAPSKTAWKPAPE